MQYHAIIRGGSFAGLSAALCLARARRSVGVLDTGKPRNRFADASYGFFAQDGSNPTTMLETMREQVAAYPTVRFMDLAAADARREGDIAERLGCVTEAGPLRPTFTVDGTKATNVPGVYGAGDITRMGHPVIFACADGVMAALAIHRSLVFGSGA